MRLLVLGGTQFLGHEVARAALASGHEVICAARGQSGSVPVGARLVHVDRDNPASYAALTGDFDAAVDVGRRPSHIRQAVAALDQRVGHWGFVSSCSVYADNATPGQRADSARLLDPATEDDPSGENYGPAKVAGEQAYAGTAFLCRAGLIVGPGDPSGRFGWWVARFLAGGPVVAPGTPEDLVQCVDVRDLADWLVLAAQAGLRGPFDGIGAPTPRATFIGAGLAGIGRSGEPVWMDQEFLAEQDVRPWMGPRAIPLWLPLPEYAGFMSRDVSASLAAGLAPRPLAETFADTASWLRAAESPPTTGLTEAEHAAVLAAWAARS
jgi:nucleoside-diphosphate-sugar epimerase